MTASAPVRASVPAVAERAMGRQPSRLRSLFAAGAVGAAAAVLTYRLLRSPPGRGGADKAD